MPIQDLITDLDAITQEHDEVQDMIDRAKKTYIGNFPPIRSALDRRQLRLDVQRLQVKAAKQYLANRNK